MDRRVRSARWRGSCRRTGAPCTSRGACVIDTAGDTDRGRGAAVLTGLGAWLPPRRVLNSELCTRMDTSDAWIRERIGIAERRMAGPRTATGDMAAEAGARAMASAGAGSVDALVLASNTPDHPCPATAPWVAHRLGLPGIPAFDVMAGCSGFVYACTVAASLIGSGTARRVLVVGAETMSSIIDPGDRATAPIFGDGAGAVVLEAGPAHASLHHGRHLRRPPGAVPGQHERAPPRPGIGRGPAAVAPAGAALHLEAGEAARGLPPAPAGSRPDPRGRDQRCARAGLHRGVRHHHVPAPQPGGRPHHRRLHLRPHQGSRPHGPPGARRGHLSRRPDHRPERLLEQPGADPLRRRRPRHDQLHRHARPRLRRARRHARRQDERAAVRLGRRGGRLPVGTGEPRRRLGAGQAPDPGQERHRRPHQPHLRKREFQALPGADGPRGDRQLRRVPLRGHPRRRHRRRSVRRDRPQLQQRRVGHLPARGRLRRRLRARPRPPRRQPVRRGTALRGIREPARGGGRGVQACHHQLDPRATGRLPQEHAARETSGRQRLDPEHHRSGTAHQTRAPTRPDRRARARPRRRRASGRPSAPAARPRETSPAGGTRRSSPATTRPGPDSPAAT